MKIAMAQCNPTVGDTEGNIAKAAGIINKLRNAAPDLVVFPELFITGYPPKDLLEKHEFIAEAEAALGKLVEHSKSCPGLGIITGLPMKSSLSEGKGIMNAAVLIEDGRILFRQFKSLLPTYDVFDEARYFDPAKDVDICSFKSEKLGISICEDAWNDIGLCRHRTYSSDPVETLAEKGATLMINISASPFTVGKEKVRFDLLKRRAENHQKPFLMVNQVGGNDDLIFDGRSFCFDSEGVPRCVLPAFEESTGVIDTNAFNASLDYEPIDDVVAVHDALILGSRDYVRKSGFDKVVLGLSGGIDSAVTCAIASRALGPENVTALNMPSPYSSAQSCEDAVILADNLGVALETVPIDALMNAYEKALKKHFKKQAPDVTEENIQARIRGNILMAFSNKFGWLLLSTGNKSELAVGYCTLYGDMSGGLAVISDVPKTLVYKLADYINSKRETIPRSIITKAPSAELKPGQMDQDALPPYDVLDKILYRYIDQGESAKRIISEGFDPATVSWVTEAIRKNEHKRHQTPPGLKITSKSFGPGRRMPIAAKYDV